MSGRNYTITRDEIPTIALMAEIRRLNNGPFDYQTAFENCAFDYAAAKARLEEAGDFEVTRGGIDHKVSVER